MSTNAQCTCQSRGHSGGLHVKCTMKTAEKEYIVSTVQSVCIMYFVFCSAYWFSTSFCNVPIVNVVVKLCVKYANFVKLCVNYANFVKLGEKYANCVKLCVKLHCRFQCSVSLCPGDGWRSWSCQTHILHQLVILDHPNIL